MHQLLPVPFRSVPGFIASLRNPRPLYLRSVVLLLIGVEKKTWSITHLYDQGDRLPPWLLPFNVLRPSRDSGPTLLY